MAHNRIFNFSAGPAVLPEEVVEKASKNLLNFADSGLGVMEISHRSGLFKDVIEGTEERLRKLLGISSNYKVLFVTGGATMQFSMVPMNLLGASSVADYIITGAWSKKAIKEASRFGETNASSTSDDENFSYLPEEHQLSENSAYVHFTSNNTIFGTQFSSEPEVGDRPLICDASSDFLHKKYGLIYAGAQKNLGPAGVTLLVLRDDLLSRSPESLPQLMNYNYYADGASLGNTPPTFPIYVLGLVLEWLEAQGGLDAIEARNKAKAGKLYDFLEANPGYRATARQKDRSLMNVCFRMTDESREADLIKQATDAGLNGLKGHRSVGGMRASIYNAFPEEGVDKLIEFLDKFAS